MSKLKICMARRCVRKTPEGGLFCVRCWKRVPDVNKMLVGDVYEPNLPWGQQSGAFHDIFIVILDRLEAPQ